MENTLFTLEKKSSQCKARSGLLTTGHGIIKTPIFMPVGTLGTVKSISNEELKSIPAQIILSNSYHLYLRPGPGLISQAGGLHEFIGWDKPMLTDSGGFQVFSLTTLRRIDSQGVEFRSHIDGSKHFFSPEKSMDVQRQIGADIVMCFDECAPYPCTEDYAKKSVDLTIDWAKKCYERFYSTNDMYGYKQYLFGIVQGSIFRQLRKESAERTMEIDFPGYAIGGVSVGEGKQELYDIVSYTAPMLPENKPRYLMGVGMPEDLWNCIEHGIDMFDCVLPTRNGRNGQAFTAFGKVNIKNAEYIKDFTPLDPECSCPACTGYSRAYINYLFRAQEILALRLLTLHNLYFMVKLSEKIRTSIENDSFLEEKKKFMEKYFGQA